MPLAYVFWHWKRRDFRTGDRRSLDLPDFTAAATVPFRRVLGGKSLAPLPEDPGFPLA